MQLQTLSAVMAALATFAVVDLFGVANPAAAIQLTGLTADNQLVSFDSATPGSTTRVSVTGITGQLLGIDLRPANNVMYGLSDSNNIYTINPVTGQATLVSTLSVAFTGGTLSGVDFNPVPDRLRVVGSNDQNLRINVDTGAVAVDGMLNPGDPSITASAYTNVDTDPGTGTTLYGIDSALDQLFIQNPPNNGTQVLVGDLGIDFGSTGGFDIVTLNGVNLAFAASGSTLYSVDLTSGAATGLGTIAAGSDSFIGLTATPVPTPALLPGLIGMGLAAWKKRQGLQAKDSALQQI
jgi:hypothetical protein